MNNDFLARARRRSATSKIIKEKDIEGAFCKHAANRGCKALKLQILKRRGFPDRTVLCPGAKIMFVEFKSKKGRLHATQEAIKKLIEYFGFHYHVCDIPGQAETILDRFLEDAGKI